MAYTIPFYKGFQIETLVFFSHANASLWRASNDRTYDVSVRVTRLDDSSAQPKSRVFKLNASVPFLNFGDARRAGDRYGQDIVNRSIDSAMDLDAFHMSDAIEKQELQ